MHLNKWRFSLLRQEKYKERQWLLPRARSARDRIYINREENRTLCMRNGIGSQASLWGRFPKKPELNAARHSKQLQLLISADAIEVGDPLSFGKRKYSLDSDHGKLKDWCRDTISIGLHS